jgi:hypothetical protein
MVMMEEKCEELLNIKSLMCYFMDYKNEFGKCYEYGIVFILLAIYTNSVYFLFHILLMEKVNA